MFVFLGQEKLSSCSCCLEKAGCDTTSIILLLSYLKKTA